MCKTHWNHHVTVNHSTETYTKWCFILDPFYLLWGFEFHTWLKKIPALLYIPLVTCLFSSVQLSYSWNELQKQRLNKVPASTLILVNILMCIWDWFGVHNNELLCVVVLSGCCSVSVCCCWQPRLWAAWMKPLWTSSGNSGRSHTWRNTMAWSVSSSVYRVWKF